MPATQPNAIWNPSRDHNSAEARKLSAPRIDWPRNIPPPFQNRGLLTEKWEGDSTPLAIQHVLYTRSQSCFLPRQKSARRHLKKHASTLTVHPKKSAPYISLRKERKRGNIPSASKRNPLSRHHPSASLNTTVTYSPSS